jgi:ferredoxin
MILTLRINPIACTGHGVCAEVAPELIEPDEWGYPIVNAGPVPIRLEREARRAVAMCPVLALKLQPAKLDGPGGTVPPATLLLPKTSSMLVGTVVRMESAL